MSCACLKVIFIASLYVHNPLSRFLIVTLPLLTEITANLAAVIDDLAFHHFPNLISVIINYCFDFALVFLNLKCSERQFVIFDALSRNHEIL